MMRSKLLLSAFLLCIAGQASAQISIQINLGQYPDFEPVPGYPVYYAPQLDENYFFYDGLYWVYQDDNWYASDWYNGPWDLVEPQFVPVYVLRVPVRYYRRPPVYFRSWQPDGPPRWDQHWGRQWAEQHRGWDHWDRRSAPKPAPLPVYQREYTGARYPDAREQHDLRERNYKYRPREETVRREENKQEEHKRSIAQQQAPAGKAPPVRIEEHRNDHLERHDVPPPREQTAAAHDRDVIPHDSRDEHESKRVHGHNKDKKDDEQKHDSDRPDRDNK